MRFRSDPARIRGAIAPVVSPFTADGLPDLESLRGLVRCSLAASITAADVRLIKQRYPDVPVVTYVNTTAEVKAETDICCTSANAVQVVEAAAAAAGTTQVILLPDEFLARNVARQTPIRIISWHGRCEVHERFTPKEVRALREDYPGVIILAHPECPPDVVAAMVEACREGPPGSRVEGIAQRDGTREELALRRRGELFSVLATA